MIFALWALATTVSVAQTLDPNTPLDADLAPTQTHSYSIALAPGQFLHLTAMQLSADIALKFILPNGQAYATIDRSPHADQEELPFLAATAGLHKIEITLARPNAPGRYRLLTALRPATPADKALSAAFSTFWMEARALADQQSATTIPQAIPKFEAAIAAFRQLDQPRWEATAIGGFAQLLLRMGRDAQALPLLERALQLHRQLNDAYGIASTLNGIALAETLTGKLPAAIQHHTESAAAFQAIAYLPGQASALHNLASAEKDAGQFPPAIQHFRQAIDLRRQINDPDAVIASLQGLAVLYVTSSDYAAAIPILSEAWQLAKDRPNLLNRASVALTLGNTYIGLGKLNEASTYWDQAEALYRQIGFQPGIASTIYSRGARLVSDDQFQPALPLLNEALALHRKMNRSAAIVNDLNQLCKAHAGLKAFPQATAAAAEAVTLARQSSYQTGALIALMCQADVAFQAKNSTAARQLYTEAAELATALNHRTRYGSALFGLAKTEAALGSLPSALQHVQRAMQVNDTLRSEYSSPDLRASYRSLFLGRLDLHTSIRMRLHAQDPSANHAAAAFEAIENYRARSLADMIVESRDDLRASLTPDQRSIEDRLLEAINRIQRELYAPKTAPARQAALKPALASAEREFELFQNSLRTQDPRYSAALSAPTADLAFLQSQLLSKESAFICFAIGENESFVFAITSSSFAAAILPPRSVIDPQITAFRRLLAAKVTSLNLSSSLARLDASATQLYKLLLGPVETALQGKTHLLIVPDRSLAYLPFETLRAPSGRLLERFTISYTPSASVLALLQSRGKQRTPAPQALFAVADPTLPGQSPSMEAYRERGLNLSTLPNARAEVNAIRALFPAASSRVLTGSDAREQAVAQAPLHQFRYVHFAAHGYLDEEQPARSALLLATLPGAPEDGLLQAPEIMRLRLNADLVTLSACQSGLGQILEGEGVMGLSRACFYAGAQSVVASLWNVNDAATSTLMKRFYAKLRQGTPRDAALRDAKRELAAASPLYRHPYYWAPFVFWGDPGR